MILLLCLNIIVWKHKISSNFLAFWCTFHFLNFCFYAYFPYFLISTKSSTSAFFYKYRIQTDMIQIIPMRVQSSFIFYPTSYHSVPCRSASSFPSWNCPGDFYQPTLKSISQKLGPHLFLWKTCIIQIYYHKMC